MRRRAAGALVAGALLASLLPGAAAARDPITRPSGPLPASVDQLKLTKPITLRDTGAGKVDRVLRTARGPQRVVVRLSALSAVDVVAKGAAAQKAQYKAARVQQDGVIAKARKLDSRTRVLGRTGRATNVLMLQIDASQLATLANDPAVLAVNSVIDYQLADAETTPYVGASAVQATGYTGAGVRVAVLDSGIDYTHVAFGGAGTAAAYQAAYGTSASDPKNTTTDGLFPTAKVIGGYDFVGESWPNTPEAPDPDPIAAPPLSAGLGTDGGHGTHVADIIAGPQGVAPGASLYAVKVCSAVATSCSGVALIEAMDFAVDPNGDGSTADHVDIVNMSLGSDYGTAFNDDLSQAVEQATKLGVLTVAASGNGGNRPYVSGTPAAAPSALSVAQTQVPSAFRYPLVVNSPAAIAGTYPNTETVEWAPLGAGFAGTVAYVGRGCPAGSVTGQPGEDAYVANPAGKVALIDRGSCSVSLKVDRAAKAGATAVLIGLITPGDPVSFSSGGGDTFVPTLVIQQSLRNAMIANIAAPVTVTVSSAVTIPLVGSMAGSSSRGPSSNNNIKPEIGAPGASVSAISGSGTGTEAFGGTSGATPMVAGAAALLKDAFPGRSPMEIKALLMNSAETGTVTNPATAPGVLAPITRIGAGELRVDRSVKAPAAIWDPRLESAALSFGFVDASDTTTSLSRELVVRNYMTKSILFKVTPTFRFANDQANGAVKVIAPSYVRVGPGRTEKITVTIRIDGRKLRAWSLNGGPDGNNPVPLDLLEYDGYVNFDQVGTKADDANPLHVPWQVLPRLSSDVSVPDGKVKIGAPLASGPLAGLPGGTTKLKNQGVGAAAIDVYSLVGTSPNLPPAKRGANAPVIDLKSVGVQTYPVPANTACGPVDSFVYQIAISTWERTTTALMPAEFDVYLDTNNDGNADYIVLNADVSGPGSLSDGRSVTWVYNVAAKSLDAWFFTGHGTNDSNTILTFCGDQIQMNATNFGQPMTMDVGAYDNYYTGNLTDSIDAIHVAPLGERYLATVGSGFLGGDVAPRTSAALTVADYGPTGTNPSETGLLLVMNADRGTYRGGAPVDRDAIRILVGASDGHGHDGP